MDIYKIIVKSRSLFIILMMKVSYFSATITCFNKITLPVAR